jgi:hypothetical protein
MTRSVRAMNACRVFNLASQFPDRFPQERMLSPASEQMIGHAFQTHLDDLSDAVTNERTLGRIMDVAPLERSKQGITNESASICSTASGTIACPSATMM